MTPPALRVSARASAQQRAFRLVPANSDCMSKRSTMVSRIRGRPQAVRCPWSSQPDALHPPRSTAVEAGGASTRPWSRETVPESGQTSLQPPRWCYPSSGMTPQYRTAGAFTPAASRRGRRSPGRRWAIVTPGPAVSDGLPRAAMSWAPHDQSSGAQYRTPCGPALNTPGLGTSCTAGELYLCRAPFTYTVAPVVTGTRASARGQTTQITPVPYFA